MWPCSLWRPDGLWDRRSWWWSGNSPHPPPPPAALQHPCHILKYHITLHLNFTLFFPCLKNILSSETWFVFIVSLLSTQHFLVEPNWRCRSSNCGSSEQYNCRDAGDRPTDTYEEEHIDYMHEEKVACWHTAMNEWDSDNGQLSAECVKWNKVSEALSLVRRYIHALSTSSNDVLVTQHRAETPTEIRCRIPEGSSQTNLCLGNPLNCPTSPNRRVNPKISPLQCRRHGSQVYQNEDGALIMYNYLY